VSLEVGLVDQVDAVAIAQLVPLRVVDERFSNRLFRNRSGLVFEDVTARAGVRGAGYSMGVAAGDYDHDGWTDLYVTVSTGTSCTGTRATAASRT
jgi:hypothetical protein